jgi:osmotically-inducible protein OsmY
VLNGDVVLDGTVENITAKRVALILAAEIQGQGRIVDRLRVAPAETMSDAEIRDRVFRGLLEEPVFQHCSIRSDATDELEPLPGSAGAISLEVLDGVVTLNGEVPSLTHKRFAGVLAWWVPGSRDVINGLEEVPPEEDNDDELTDAVRLVLEKDPFVNATELQVSSKDWNVTLGGVVPTETIKQMAEHDAWYVLGVKNVINTISVEH